MRRRWGLAMLICAAPVAASAQPADVSAAAEPESGPAVDQTVVYGAMPGGLHTPSAETLPKGVAEVSMLSGMGRRTGLLGPDHKFNRAIGDIAFGYGISDLLSVGLALDGRYDRHWGVIPSGDDGFVGDPHLNIRIAKAVGANRFGVQVGVWIPGNNAPSLTPSATSVDVRGLAGIAAGPATLSIDAGFRLDNSLKSAPMYTTYTVQDQASLGVSYYNAVLAGAQLTIPAGKAFVGLEGSLEAYVGSPPAGKASLQEGSLLIRGGVVGGFHISDTLSALVWLEGAKVPGVLLAQVMAHDIPLVPFEPIVSGGLGVEARFGGTKRPDYEKDCHKHNPPDCPAVKVPITADITGTVVDQADKPIVGARVTLTLKNSQVPPVATDDKGTYIFKGVPIGQSVDNVQKLEETGVEVDVNVDGKKPGKASVAAVAAGANNVPPIKLEPVTPPGQLRGTVRSLASGGKAVSGATITVVPGDVKVESGADGTFTVDLAPGQYKITVKATGLAPQELDVVIDPNGVAIKNIDLHK